MILLAILFLFLSFGALAYAGYCSAVQDTVLHHFTSSIFYQPGTTKKKYGFDWNWWYKSDWRNKWMTDKDGNLLLDKFGNRIPRLTKILFWKIQLVQFYDAWHHYKMLKIGMNIIADIMASIAAILIFISLSPSIVVWTIIGILYFICQAFIWNWMFNNNYNNWMLSKNAKATLEFKLTP